MERFLKRNGLHLFELNGGKGPRPRKVEIPYPPLQQSLFDETTHLTPDAWDAYLRGILQQFAPGDRYNIDECTLQLPLSLTQSHTFGAHAGGMGDTWGNTTINTGQFGDVKAPRMDHEDPTSCTAMGGIGMKGEDGNAATNHADPQRLSPLPNPSAFKPARKKFLLYAFFHLIIFFHAFHQPFEVLILPYRDFRRKFEKCFEFLNFDYNFWLLFRIKI